MGKRVCVPSQKALIAKEETATYNQNRGQRAQSSQLTETLCEQESNAIVIPIRESKKANKLKAIPQWNEVVQSGNKKQSPSSSGTKSWADQVEEELEQPTKQSSIWENFDISKLSNTRFKLEYVAPTVQGESSIVDIELEDIASEIEYWNPVVCYVLGAHPPFPVLNGYIQRIWAKHGINKVSMLKNGIVLVRFDTELEKNKAIQGGIYHFDNKPFIVKAWCPNIEFTREELYTMQIWIKLPGLDFKYWSPKGLSKIDSLIGKSLMVDQNTQKKIGLNFARLLIEVGMDIVLPDCILFRNKKD
ncbi:uncharacterized protein [Nicotiana sylvestris]|uniref:uncharacterized protein n=1 Tax=Nicotiana sylvestris TaxID=4096 RepID=UPI00388C3A3C